MDLKWVEKEVPPFTIALKVPNIPGQDTSKLSKMPWKMKQRRKTIQMVCATTNVQHLQGLMKIAKDRELVAHILG